MDAANLTEKYILWSNILDLRSRGINIARTARRLGVSRNTVRHLQSLSLEEVLQHKERHYKLHAYEQAVASLLLQTFCSSTIGFKSLFKFSFNTEAKRKGAALTGYASPNTIYTFFPLSYQMPSDLRTASTFFSASASAPA